MRRRRSRALGVLGVSLVVAAAVAAGIGAAAVVPPSATVSQAAVAGSPSALECKGSLNGQVAITGHAATVGQATDVELVLDVSGSMGSPSSKFTALKAAAKATIDALDAADGHTDQSIAGNRVGIVRYSNSSGTEAVALGASYTALVTGVETLPSPGGGSPHNAGINAGVAALGSGGNAKAIVLITDGQATGTLQSATSTAAADAKAAGIRIVPIGISADTAGRTNLENWASSAAYYQGGTVDQGKLRSDLGALVSTPASFAVTVTPGANFALDSQASALGSAILDGGAVKWTGALDEGQSATLTYRATRNGNDVFSVTNETVSTVSATVTDGTATVTPPAAITINVLPCGGSLLDTTTCTGSSCSVAGTQGGVQYSVNAGTPAAGTSVFLTGLSTPPPTGVCPGFNAATNGAQFDIRPLTTDATFQITIPKASLGSKKWWQTDVCLATNLKFTTALNSLANLRPGATLVNGSGSVPGRYWGLLPSLPRLTFVQGLGWIRGPWITNRAQNAAGDAVITFKVPYVAGSASYTTDGLAGYDPKSWGG